MSFGGAVSTMITSLKNNKRKRISTFDKINNHNTKSKIKLHFNKQATSEELLKIKAQIKLENKKILRKNCIVFCVLLLIFIYVIGFVKF